MTSLRSKDGIPKEQLQNVTLDGVSMPIGLGTVDWASGHIASHWDWIQILSVRCVDFVCSEGCRSLQKRPQPVKP